MIVQCKNCETRFSVDSDLFKNISNPRFHCSRCDHYFQLPENLTIEENTLSTDHSSDFMEEFEIEEPSTNESLDIEDPFCQEEETPSSLKNEPLESDDIEVEDIDWPPRIDSSTSTIPTLSTSPTKSSLDDPNLLRPSWPDIKSPEPIRNDFSTQNSSLDEPNNIAYPQELPLSSVESTKVSYSEISTDKTWRKLGLIAAIPLCFAASLYYLSNNIENLPDLAKNYLFLTPRNLPTIPPAGVEILSLASKTTFLDDGTEFIEVAGEVINDSPFPIEQALVEVKLFDQEGSTILRNTVSTSSKIADADSINSLSKEVLLEMQSNTRRGSPHLGEDGGRKKFRMVLFETPKTSSFYSARVYSVDNSKKHLGLVK